MARLSKNSEAAAKYKWRRSEATVLIVEEKTDTRKQST
jgi:hypothetical protein